jgi:heme-degrading monooxygenase HmoA
MIVIVFRSKLRPDCPASYGPLADRMVELAQEIPGFVSFRHYAADDGERVSIAEFASEDAARAWREHPEHLEAQRRGRDEFYAWYRIQVCGQAREREFSAKA